jgi:hypothetical protein
MITIRTTTVIREFAENGAAWITAIRRGDAERSSFASSWNLRLAEAVLEFIAREVVTGEIWGGCFMADVVACRCHGTCGLHEGDCGKPVEQPNDRAAVLEEKVGPWYKTDLCDVCRNAIRSFVAGR